MRSASQSISKRLRALTLPGSARLNSCSRCFASRPLLLRLPKLGEGTSTNSARLTPKRRGLVAYVHVPGAEVKVVQEQNARPSTCLHIPSVAIRRRTKASTLRLTVRRPRAMAMSRTGRTTPQVTTARHETRAPKSRPTSSGNGGWPGTIAGRMASGRSRPSILALVDLHPSASLRRGQRSMWRWRVWRDTASLASASSSPMMEELGASISTTASTMPTACRLSLPRSSATPRHTRR